MKIIALPDLHEGIKFLPPIAEQLAAVDLVLLVGDITNSSDHIAPMIDAVRQYNPAILAVSGNWDKPDSVDPYLTQENMNLHRCHRVIDDLVFFGVGGALISTSRTVNEISENDFRAFLHEAIAGADASLPKILVCHQPPFQTKVDKAWVGLHIGSKEVCAFIEETQPLLCFSGHVHEAAGIDQIGDTQVINPGPIWKGGYAYAEIVDQQIVALEIRRC